MVINWQLIIMILQKRIRKPKNPEKKINATSFDTLERL